MKRTNAIDWIVRSELATLSAAERFAYVATAIDEGLLDERPHLAALTEQPEDQAFDAIIIETLRESYVGTKNEYVVKRLQILGSTETNVEGKPEPLKPCPCCRYCTLEHRGQYEICRVCGWEDTGIDDPTIYSGPNHCTLADARARLQTPEMIHVINEAAIKYPREGGYAEA